MLKRLILFISLANLTYVVYSDNINPSCSVVQYITKCNVDRNRCTVERTMLVEIKDRSAEKYAEIAIPFSKKEKVVILSAQIEDVKGNIIRQLKKSEYKDRSAVSGYSLYEDNFVRTFELKHNVYPYRIRYQWKFDYDEFIDIVHWAPYLDELVPTQSAKLEVQVPLDYPVKIYKNRVEHAKMDTLGSNIVYTFEVSNLELPKEEVNSIPTERIAAYVRVVPVNFKWSCEGSHLSWKDFGNWINNLNAGSDDLSEVDKEKVRTLIKGLSGRPEIVTALYKYLQQHTRYINVSIGTGGLKPFPASYVAKNNYGDCKALTVFMKSMLQTVDIPSYYTVIYAGEGNPGITKEITGVQFNHAILCVPMGKDTVFLDCTRQNVPLGYMGTFTQGREAFVIKKDSSYFTRIPGLKADEVKENSIHTYNLSMVNNCSVLMQNKSQGHKFDYLAAVDKNLNFMEAENLLREKYFYFPSFELQNWELKQPHKDSAYVMLKASLQLNNYLKSYGQDLGFPIYPLAIPNFEKPSDRKLPLLFEYPVNVEDVFIYNLDSPLQPKLLPEEIQIESKYGNYYLKAVFNENVITIHRKFEVFNGEYPLTEYADFYNFIQKIIKNNKLIIMLTK